MPPEGSYSVDASDVMIATGKNQSTQIKVTADSEQLQEGVSYCLPVSITSVSDGDFKVMESSRTAYVMLTKVINIKAAYLKGGQSFDIPSFGGEDSPVKALQQMTLEMKVYPKSFPEPEVSLRFADVKRTSSSVLVMEPESRVTDCSWLKHLSEQHLIQIRKTTMKHGLTKISKPTVGITSLLFTMVSICVYTWMESRFSL